MPSSSATPIAASAVLDVVPPRHRQFDPLDRAGRAVAIAHDHLEPVAAGYRCDIDPAHVGLRREAIRHHAPIAHPRQDVLHFRMIEAQHRRAVEGHVLDELHKRVLHRIERAVMVEMLGIDVSDDGDGAVQPQEAAVALIGLNHHPVRRASRAFEP